MQENLVLEENQVKEYSDLLGGYLFTAAYAGAEVKESPVLKAKKPGVRLHFLRFGLFHEETTRVAVPDNNAIHVISLKDAPSLENFHVAPTSLNPGYLYIMVENQENLWFEYEVNDVGHLHPILWKDNKDKKGNYLDLRKSSRQSEKDKTFKHGTILWVAYSPVQWTVEQHTKIRTDAQAREKRMRKIECTGFEKGAKNTHENALPYDEIVVEFLPGNPQASWYQDTLEEIRIDEEKAAQKKDTFKEDMFITLHDPIGCANDIGSALISEYNRLDAIIESIQTGEDDKAILERLEQNKLRNKALSEYEKQVNGLFSTSLSLYQLLYNERELEKEYGSTTDKNKLIKILAVNERKEQRKKIASLRDDFGNFLSHNYYQESIIEFDNCVQDSIFEGNFIICQHLSLLSVHPNDKDRFLDLKKDYQGKNDKWAPFFTDILQTKKYKVSILLEKEVKLEGVSEEKFEAKYKFKLGVGLIKTLKSITETFAKYATRNYNFEATLDYIKSFKYRKEPVIQLRKKELKSKLGQTKYALFLKREVENNRLASTKGAYIKILAKEGDDAVKEVVVNQKLILEVQAQGNKASTFIKQVLASPKFRAFVAGLELINVTVSINTLAKQKSLQKDAASTFGAMSTLVSASASYHEAMLLSKTAPDILKSPEFAARITRITTFSKVVGFVGSGTSVVMCVWDSAESWQSRDYDTSVVWAFTGALSAVLLANSIHAFVTGAALGFLGFWPLVIFTVLAFGGVLLAIYFTDSPLEKFLKNNPLSSRKKLQARSSELPFQYIRKMHNQRDLLVSDKFADWRDFEKTSLDLYDLLGSYRVEKNVEKFDTAHKDVESSNPVKKLIREVFHASNSGWTQTKEVKITVNLRKFLYNKSEFHYQMLLFLDGISNPARKYPIESHKQVLQEVQGMNTLEIYFTVPDVLFRELTLSSEFVFLSQAVVNEGLQEYWPQQNNGKRFNGFKFSTVRFNDPTLNSPVMDGLATLYGKNIRIGTKSEVLDVQNWK